jgi:oligopeptide/dipeptide ABC transporter ATP-binding protein
VLSIAGLSVVYPNGAWAVRDVSLSIRDGECLALVGESGCGKSSLVLAILGLLPAGTRVGGEVKVDGRSLIGISGKELRRLRGKKIGYVAQDPFAACDPLRKVDHHVREAWTAHGMRVPHGEVAQRLENLGIDDAKRRSDDYPHQWSGGMLQRATIAAATVHGPALTVADEPTSALDADRADGVLRALKEASRGLLLVSHDLRLVADHADSVAVMYAGRLAEVAAVDEVMRRPRHPYTQALIAASPRRGAGLPRELPGTPPPLKDPIPGCAFSPRCPYALEECSETTPELMDGVACLLAEK